MNTDTRHGGLRPKRCLTVQFHSIIAHYQTSPKANRQNSPADSPLVSPSHGQTIVTAPKRANSRFFTDCYPISAAFAPRVNQTPARLDTIPIATSDHAIHN